uniref:Uncharacterized protein n=1 Tax=Amphora coffeiformis TaxID=265554 RepID=A0A7S3P7U0_9STRA|eukprot:scaffold39901_cov229-Amphora_coffeaeformis.AAC.3
MTLLYAASFPTTWWVQFWYSFQAGVAGSMGMLAFCYPNTPAIAVGGYWKYLGETEADISSSAADKGKTMLAPNARAWGLRNAFAAVANVLALYYGTKETYVVMAAIATWREVFDIIEAYWENDTYKVWMPKKVPSGKFPPLGYFPPYAFLLVVDLATLYVTLTAATE